MESYKTYRFDDNPKEKEFFDKFFDMFNNNMVSKKTLSAIIFGWSNGRQNYPKEYLSKREEDICINLIQWLGSSVGQSFLNDCGFYEKE